MHENRLHTHTYRLDKWYLESCQVAYIYVTIHIKAVE